MSRRGVAWCLAATLALAGCSPGPASLDRSSEAALEPPRTAEGVVVLPAKPTTEAIAQFEKRVAEDPRDYISATVLGELHARRGRETGDLASYGRAETTLRQALALEPDYARAKALLAAALASQHKFPEAIALARDLSRQSPAAVDALATLADAYLETGRYEEGLAAVAELAQRVPGSPAVLARRAHVAELTGRDLEALDSWRRAAGAAREQAESPLEPAWYETRLGHLYYHRGCLAEAAAHYQASVDLYDGYYIGLTGLAEVREAEGRLQDALDLYRRAAATAPQPGTLFQIGRVLERLGDRAGAARQFAEAQAAANRPDVHHAAYFRDLALFYADREGRTKEAVDYARMDLAIRGDIEAYDTLAYALYRDGRLEEAAAASAKSLALGTRDPHFHYHAGLIHARLGNAARARTHLEEAIQIGAAVLGPDAREILAQLGGAIPKAGACTLQAPAPAP
jgi:tetratricopeptide (TPR) repeat protein